MIHTERLILRPWRETDRAPLAEITSDAETMRFFNMTRDRAQSDAWLDRVRAHFDAYGFGIWAVEAPGVAPLIGFVGLSRVPDTIPSAPAGGQRAAAACALPAGPTLREQRDEGVLGQGAA